MVARARGYHYVRLPSGRKRRVYNNKRRAVKQRRPYRRSYPYAFRGIPDTIMGYGAYHRAGSRVGMRGGSGGPPEVKNSADGGMIIRHREFLTDIPSSEAFTSTVIPLNVGLATSFPWLSRVAQNFEEWIPRGIIFEFKTTSSDTLISNSPSLGSIVMATQYNSLNPDFQTKQQMENYQYAVSTKPSQSLIHAVETKRSQTVLSEQYVRTGPVPTGGDIKMYDLGKTQIAVVGSQTNGHTLGELWMSYEIELRKPKIPEDPLVKSAHWIIDPATPGLTAATIFGTDTSLVGPTVASTLRNAAIQGGASYGTIHMGPNSRGLYMISLSTRWNVGGTAAGVTLGAATNCSYVNAFEGNSSIIPQDEDAGTSTRQDQNSIWVIDVTGENATMIVTIGGGVSGGLKVPADLWITELPDRI